MPAESSRLCFVLMPFKDSLFHVYLKAIKPACERAGFDPLRVDELKGMFNIHRKIIEHIFISEAIIADLTEWNPNVFYEMGVAHAIDNKTIIIIQRQNKLPFDVTNYRCIRYDNTDEGLEKLSSNITEGLLNIDELRKYPSNPVQDFKPCDAFVSNKILQQMRSDLERKDALLSNMEAEHKSLKDELDRERDNFSTLQQRMRLLQQKLSGKSTPFQASEFNAISIRLRTQPLDQLSYEEVKLMLKRNGFFESGWNRTGNGFAHFYETIEHHSTKIVIDNATDLAWQQAGSETQMDYKEASEYIVALNQQEVGGYNIWRMPTLEEAMSLMEPIKQDEKLFLDVGFDRKQSWIWTADKENPSMAWVVNFNDGICLSRPFGDSRYVRAVLNSSQNRQYNPNNLLPTQTKQLLASKLG